MQKINLPLPFQLAVDRIPDDPFVITADDRFHRQTIERRRFDRGHIFHSDKREIERARNWGGRKGENVDQLK